MAWRFLWRKKRVAKTFMNGTPIMWMGEEERAVLLVYSNDDPVKRVRKFEIENGHWALVSWINDDGAHA
jgi:hypothetical protein